MALPTPLDAKLYCRIETADEDVLVSQLLARAKATVEWYIGYPMTAVATTYVNTDVSLPGFSTAPYRYSVAELQLPGPFLLTAPAPIVTDVNGTVVDPTTYVLDNREGRIRSKDGSAIFGSLPYTVVATIGLSAHPDYAARLEAVASIAILDLVAHLYQNRNPAVISESDEGGSSQSLSPDAIPPRIRQDLWMLPCTRGLIVA